MGCLFILGSLPHLSAAIVVTAAALDPWLWIALPYLPCKQAAVGFGFLLFGAHMVRLSFREYW